MKKITRSQRDELVEAMIAQLEDLYDALDPEPGEEERYDEIYANIVDDVRSAVRRHLDRHLKAVGA